MKRLLLGAAALFLAATSWAASDVITPRFGYTEPAIGSLNWGTKLNLNFGIADLYGAALHKSNIFQSTCTFNAPVVFNQAPTYAGLLSGGIVYASGGGALSTHLDLTFDPTFANFYTMRLGSTSTTNGVLAVAASSTTGNASINVAGGATGPNMGFWSDPTMNTGILGQFYGTTAFDYPLLGMTTGDFLVLAGATNPDQTNRLFLGAGDAYGVRVSSSDVYFPLRVTATNASNVFGGSGAGLLGVLPANLGSGRVPDSVQVATGSIVATGTPSATTYLRGDGSWTNPGAYWNTSGSDIYPNNAGDVLIATGPNTSQARLTITDTAGASGASLALYENALGGSVWKFNNFAGVFYQQYNGGTYSQTTSGKFTSFGDGAGGAQPEISLEAVHDSTTSATVFSPLDANLSARNSSNANMKVVMGYNSAAEKGWIQAVKVGTGNKPLLLNPNGGAVSVMGTSAADNATAGNYGEFVSTTSVAFTNVATSGQFGNVVSSNTFTAGDWDLMGCVTVSLNSSVMTDYEVAISSFSANTTTDHVEGYNWLESAAFPIASANATLCVPSYRATLSGTTTFYLKVKAAYTVATPQALGTLTGRRAR